MPVRVLVVDDDTPSVKMIGFLLNEEGYEVRTAYDGHAALHIIDKEPIDLVILDVMMPRMDGMEVCRRIRRTLNTPIIFLSARGETSDKVAGLEVGADDYLAKPFEPTELLARVKAVLRRTEAYTFGDSQTQLTVGDLRLLPIGNKVVRSDGTEIELTPIEFRLLYCLMRNAERTLPHDVLLSSVWGYEYEGYSNQIAVYMRRLRAKIEEDPGNPKRLVTVRGLGYRFERL